MRVITASSFKEHALPLFAKLNQLTISDLNALSFVCCNLQHLCIVFIGIVYHLCFRVILYLTILYMTIPHVRHQNCTSPLLELI